MPLVTREGLVAVMAAAELGTAAENCLDSGGVLPFFLPLPHLISNHVVTFLDWCHGHSPQGAPQAWRHQDRFEPAALSAALFCSHI